MKAAIFATRRNEEVSDSVIEIKKNLQKYNLNVDMSYFDTTVEHMATDLTHTYNAIKNILLRCDVVIVENSFPSTGMGLIIGRVMELKKPMLVLVNKEDQDKRGPSIVVKAHGLKMNKVLYREYTNQDLEKVIAEFIQEAKKLLNSKFLFNLSPEMATYLQWSSEYYNRPMVDVLRELINNNMKENSDWQEYLKTL